MRTIPAGAACCLTFFLLGSAATAAEGGGDWSRFRGDDGQGRSPASKPPTSWTQDQNILWKIELPGAGASSPIIVGGRLYLTTWTGSASASAEDSNALVRHLVAIDPEDGRVIWKSSVPALLPEDTKNRESHGYSTSTPTADAERIYVFYGKSGALAFAKDGKKLWHADVGSQTNGWGSAASPVLHEDLLLVNASVESESLVALEKQTGKERWRARGIKESWNAPILVKTKAGKSEIVLAIIGKVLGLDPATGKEIWAADTDIGWYMVPGLVAADGVVYAVGGRTGGSLAVRLGGTGDVTATHRLWTTPKGSNVPSPILHEGHLYWLHENLGIFYCAEAASGKIVFEKRIEGCDQVYASPVLVKGDEIVVVTRSGRSFILAAKPSFELRGSNEPLERSAFNSSPAVWRDRIYLRSDRSLYAIGSKDGGETKAEPKAKVKAKAAPKAKKAN